MTLSNSADIMVKHLIHLDVKRIKYNSNDLNTSTTKRLILGLQLLTRYAEKQTENAFLKRENYYLVRVSQISWLVLHKNALNDGDDYELPFESINDVHIARYAVVYEVTVNTTFTEVQCSCKFKRRYGMPCVHNCGALQNRFIRDGSNLTTLIFTMTKQRSGDCYKKLEHPMIKIETVVTYLEP